MRKRIKALSLRHKLLASYLLVFVIATSTLVWYAVNSSSNMVYQNNRQTITGMVERARDNLDRKVEQYEQSISLCVYQENLQEIYANKYATMYDLYDKLSNTFVPFFNGVLGSYTEEVSAIRVYSLTGLNKYSNYIYSASSAMGQDWYEQAMGKSGINWAVKDGDIYATCVIEPISTMLGRNALGLFYMQLDTTALLSRYVQLSWPEYSLSIRTASGEELLALNCTGGERSIAQNARHNMELFTAHSASLGWQLEFAVPDSALRGSGISFFSINSVVIAVCVIILLLVILLFTHTLFAGLDRLKKSMDEVNDGDLNITITSESQDEIGALTNTFNTMLATIRGLIEQTRQNERQLSGLEVRALRAQIDPHFLYNTLSFINWKCIRAGQDDVSEVISQLSIFYRTCLNKGRELTDVGNEIVNIRAYITIQLHMHDNSFDVLYLIPPELNKRQMLSFVLQPLVENAIIHGVDELRPGIPGAANTGSPARGLIEISLIESDGKLIFTVKDNGPGLSREVLRKLSFSQASEADSPGTGGYGIKNVHDRIILCYGEHYGIYVDNRAEGGCMARLELPAHI